MKKDILHSYHIFYFPFKWEKRGMENEYFSKRFNLDNIQPHPDSQWQNLPYPMTEEYKTELYNEKNFFYDFIHNLLYDSGKSNNIIRHFERKEAYDDNLAYEIKVFAGNVNTYHLHIKSIVLNLYSTGTGILLFYLENDNYPEVNDILRINQYGRRVFPPFLNVQTGILGTKKAELADHIAILGLKGDPGRYFEDFIGYNASSDTWTACKIIQNLIADLSDELAIKPVIDDRMHVVSWIGNEEWSNKIKGDANDIYNSDEWYKFLFVDGSYCTCQNDKMKNEIIDKHTFFRWQKEGSLFGVSRYSMVYLSNNSPFCREVTLRHFRTMYARMIELSLIQRASILKFSNEVTQLSGFSEKNESDLVDRISDFYSEYIRFVNQVYFREVTAQEQGIELYNLIQDKMKIYDQVKDLDKEISELHQYATLLEDKKRNKSLSLLTMIGAIFIIPSFIAGLYGMNIIDADSSEPLRRYFWITAILGFLSPLMVVLYLIYPGHKYRKWFLLLSGLFLLSAFVVFYFLLIINN